MKPNTANSSTVVAVIAALMLAAAFVLYFDRGTPSLVEPKCQSSEIKVWSDGWYCVLGRKP